MDTGRAANFGWLSSVWPAAVLGVVIGAVVGLLGASAVGSNSTTATALVRIDEPIDPNQIMSNSPASPDSQQSYLSGEITYLSSPGFGDSVAGELKQPERPTLSATQRGQSSVVEIAATAPDADAATKAVTAALKIYEAHAQQVARDRGQAAVDAIEAVMKRTTDQANTRAADLNAPVDQAWLDQRLKELDGQQLSLKAQMELPAAVQIVAPPVAQVDRGAVDPTLGVIGGALVGGALAVGAALTWRNRVGFLMSRVQVQQRVDRVLSPVIELGLRRQRNLRAARQLYGQLSGAAPGPIVVIGASGVSGTDAVAKLLAGAAKEHSRTVVLDLANDFGGADREKVRTAVVEAVESGGPKTVIVDGGSVGTSPQVVDIADLATQIVVVVRLGRDVEDDLAVVSELAAAHSAPVATVCTRGFRNVASNPVPTAPAGDSSGE